MTKLSAEMKAYFVTVIAFTVIGIYGLKSHFDGFYSAPWVSEPAALIAAPIALYFGLFPILRPFPDAKYSGYGPIKRFVIILILLPAMFFLSWIAVSEGMTALITRNFGNEYVKEYAVEWKTTGTPRYRDCTYAIRIRLSEMNDTIMKCIDKNIWTSVNQGDVVIGEGHQSKFGTMVREVRPHG